MSTATQKMKFYRSSLNETNRNGTLGSAQIETPLGAMLAIGNNEALYLLEFVDCRGLQGEVELIQKKTKCTIVPGYNNSIRSIENELDQYFGGKLADFKTPLILLGSPFQKLVWQELQKIPHGETRSYLQISFGLGKPRAFRAVAQANGANQLAIIIPCHRVINANGALGGYAGGVERKNWLLNHEKK